MPVGMLPFFVFFLWQIKKDDFVLVSSNKSRTFALLLRKESLEAVEIGM